MPSLDQSKIDVNPADQSNGVRDVPSVNMPSEQRESKSIDSMQKQKELDLQSETEIISMEIKRQPSKDEAGQSQEGSLPDSDMESCSSAEEEIDLTTMDMDIDLTENNTVENNSNSRNAEGSSADDDSFNRKTVALNEFLSVKRESLPTVNVKRESLPTLRTSRSGWNG